MNNLTIPIPFTAILAQEKADSSGNP